MDKYTLSGSLAAIAASLCCIIPLLAFVAGVSGFVSAFSWIVSMRPYLIAFTIIVLSIAWYKKLKSSKSFECNCENGEKESFFQSKRYLGFITIFVIIMIFFPYYSKIFYPNVIQKTVIVKSQNITNKEFNVVGMTCSSCEESVKQTINTLNGIISVKASYETGKVNVKFDNTKTNEIEIIKKINFLGYKIKE